MRPDPPRAATLAVVAGLLALGAILPAPADAAQAVLQVTATPVPAVSPPGTTGSIAFAMKNAGDATAYAIRATVQRTDPGLWLNATEVELGALGPGESTSAVALTFAVPPSTQAGFYKVAFTLTYLFNTGTTTDASDTGVTATVVVRPPSPLALAGFAPDHVQPGQEATARVTFANQGNGALSNLDASWSSPGGAILPLELGDHLQVPTLGPYANTTLAFPVAVSPNAPRGLATVAFTVRYNDQTGARLNATFTVGVVVGGATSFHASLLRTTVETVVVRLANTGLNDAASVVAAPAHDGAAGSETAFLGPLPAGEAKSATFHLALGAGGPGPGQLRLAITYTDTAGAVQSVEVPVAPPGAGGNPEVAVNVQEVDGAIVTLAVTNAGLDPVQGVVVRIVPEGGLQVDGARQVALGNLAPGEFLTADFEVHRSWGASGQAARAEVEYTDGLGTRQAESAQLDLSAAPARLTLPVWGVVALTVAAVLAAEAIAAAIWWRRRGKGPGGKAEPAPPAEGGRGE